ncbi:hypothetical protein B0H19DRAFT_451377 [Mycena capillaripes]|nr:hypothetical protein B0H19DRAFT_451377 [Mycena capillaripes]
MIQWQSNFNPRAPDLAVQMHRRHGEGCARGTRAVCESSTPPPCTRNPVARYVLTVHITHRAVAQLSSLLPLLSGPFPFSTPSMPSFAHVAVFALFSGAMATSSRRHLSDILLRRASNAAATNYLCVAFNLNTNTSWDGAPLTRAANASHGPLLQCTYSDGDLCTYTPGNGSMQTGSKTCPPSNDAFKSTKSHFDCKQTDLKHSPLIGASITPTAENLACVYSDAALCTYSQFTGTLSTGDGNCPLTASSSADCPVSSPLSPRRLHPQPPLLLL